MNDMTKPQLYNEYDAPHTDLREFLRRVESAGELLRMPGVDWNLEMGTLAEIINQRRSDSSAPAILFEDIPGYHKGFRVLSGATNSMKRLAITMGFRCRATLWMQCAPIATACRPTSRFRRVWSNTARCLRMCCAMTMSTC